jgi:hypothetical protein
MADTIRIKASPKTRDPEEFPALLSLCRKDAAAEEK